VFWYSGWTDRQTDRQTDREIYPVWASLTTFLQVHPLRVGWRNFFRCLRKDPPAIHALHVMCHCVRSS
jgi:hypothetical protein